MKEELSDILYKFKDDLFYFEEEAISEILTLFNKKIEDSKDKIAASIYDWLPTTSWLKTISDVNNKAQDIINIIKGEISK